MKEPKKERVAELERDRELWWKLVNTKDKELEAKAMFVGRNMQARAWRLLGS